MPLIVVDPKSKSAGERCGRPASLLDIYPTLVELCNLSPHEHLDGQSLAPLLHDPTTASDRAVVTTQGLGNHAIRSQHWRYIRYADGSEELYDDRRDPNEFTNLAGHPKHDAIKLKLAARLPATNAALNPTDRNGERNNRTGKTNRRAGKERDK